MKNKNNSIIYFLILILIVQSYYTVTLSNKYKSQNSTGERSSFKMNSKIKFTNLLNSQIKGMSNYKMHNLHKLSDKNKKDNEKSNEALPDLDENIGKLAIWQGWIKYFYYKTGKKFSEPKDFFVNNYFYRQRIEKSNLEEKGALPGEKDDSKNNIFKNIPTKFHFFATLNNNYLQIKGDRINPLTSHIESLNLDIIDPVHPTDMEKTGLKEIGRFEEGFCFDLSTHLLMDNNKAFIPTVGDYKTSEPFHWILCLDEEEQYTTLVGLLTNLLNVRESLRDRGESKSDATKTVEANEEHYEGIDANPLLDGYLVKINDWTQCTLKCGGGWSFQQWKCVPPKEGGKPCVGDLIRKKKCNEELCPEISSGSGSSSSSPTSTKTTEEAIADPIIKSAYVFNRPQQNIDGFIREEDVMHEYMDKVNGKISLPSRMILNSNSISLYSDLEDKKTIFSWDILKTKLVPIKGQDCCFFLRNQNKEHKICGMSQCGSFVRSWARSYDLFKAKSYEAKDAKPFNPFKANPPVDPSSGTTDGDLAMTMEMDEPTANAKKQAISEKVQSKLVAKSVDTVNQTRKDMLKAINREIDIEELIRKEEMLRTQERLRSKVEEFKHEEKKKQKLEEAIDKKQESQTTVVKELKTKQEVLEIKKEAAQDVLKKRDELKKKLKKIRILADRKAKIIQNKINIIRNKMTKEIVSATKFGNSDTCKNAWGNENLEKSYCDENFIDDLSKNVECKGHDNFCFSCCDNEFGPANVTYKENCYGACLSKEGLRGDWKPNPKLAKK